MPGSARSSATSRIPHLSHRRWQARTGWLAVRPAYASAAEPSPAAAVAGLLHGCGSDGDSTPANATGAAADLQHCCTAGDKDFPKVGGNLGNQNYSGLRQITRSDVKTLGGLWINHVNGGVALDGYQPHAVYGAACKLRYRITLDAG